MTDTIKKLQEVREALAYAASYRFGDGDISHWMQKNLATLDAVIAEMAAQVMGELFTRTTRTPEDAEATGAEGVPAPSPATNAAPTPEQRGWQPIETAPVGRYKTIRAPKGDRQVFVPEWCFVMNDGVRHWTYKTESGRWVGMTDKQKGDCWHAAPVAEKRLLGKEQPNDH